MVQFAFSYSRITLWQIQQCKVRYCIFVVAVALCFYPPNEMWQQEHDPVELEESLTPCPIVEVHCGRLALLPTHCFVGFVIDCSSCTHHHDVLCPHQTGNQHDHTQKKRKYPRTLTISTAVQHILIVCFYSFSTRLAVAYLFYEVKFF